MARQAHDLLAPGLWLVHRGLRHLDLKEAKAFAGAAQGT
jgi:hypothetical protein